MILINYKKGERYKVYNALSDYHGYFLTIVKKINNVVYYLFDGNEEVKYFEVGSNFEVDLIKVAWIERGNTYERFKEE